MPIVINKKNLDFFLLLMVKGCNKMFVLATLNSS